MAWKEQHLPLRFHPTTKPFPVSSEILFPSSSTLLLIKDFSITWVVCVQFVHSIALCSPHCPHAKQPLTICHVKAVGSRQGQQRGGGNSGRAVEVLHVSNHVGHCCCDNDLIICPLLTSMTLTYSPQNSHFY
jgi:hypothetical protein